MNKLLLLFVCFATYTIHAEVVLMDDKDLGYFAESLADGIGVFYTKNSIDICRYGFDKSVKESVFDENPFMGLQPIAISVQPFSGGVDVGYISILQDGNNGLELVEYKIEENDSGEINVSLYRTKKLPELDNPILLIYKGDSNPLIMTKPSGGISTHVYEYKYDDNELDHIGTIDATVMAAKIMTQITDEQDKDGFNLSINYLCVATEHTSSAYSYPKHIKMYQLKYKEGKQRTEISNKGEEFVIVDMDIDLLFDGQIETDFTLTGDEVTSIELVSCNLPDEDDNEIYDMFLIQYKNTYDRDSVRSRMVFIYKNEKVSGNWELSSNQEARIPRNTYSIFEKLAIVDETSDKIVEGTFQNFVYHFTTDGILDTAYVYSFMNFTLENWNEIDDEVYYNYKTANLMGVVYGPSPDYDYSLDDLTYGEKIYHWINNGVEVGNYEGTGITHSYKQGIGGGARHKVTSSGMFWSIGSVLTFDFHTISTKALLEEREIIFENSAKTFQNYENAPLGILMFQSPSKVRHKMFDLEKNIRAFDLFKYTLKTAEVSRHTTFFLIFDLVNPSKDDYYTHGEYLKGMAGAPGTSFNPRAWDPTSDEWGRDVVEGHEPFNPSNKEYKEYSNTKRIKAPTIGEMQSVGYRYEELNEKSQSISWDFTIGSFIYYTHTFETAGVTRNSKGSFLKFSRGNGLKQDVYDSGKYPRYDLFGYLISPKDEFGWICEYAHWIPDYYRNKGDRPWVFTYTTDFAEYES